MPTVCLNMIVKNESRIILRLLETVLPIIDGYCICDTGSTDNTKELITEFFTEREIPGKIVEEPFQDFGYNRTYALKACEQYMPEMDYILLVDADMTLIGPALTNPAGFKRSLIADMYNMYQGNPKFYYKNARIIRNNKGFTYWGVTHEYVNSPPNSSVGTIDRDVLFIHDIGDGGAKGDKTERDIRLLKKGLEDIPNNDRYTFYLANSYRDAGQNENAIETYKKRIQIGGWTEEVWYSYYSIGNSYMRMGQEEHAISAWMDGYNAYPKRIENLYKIIEHYRVRGKNQIAYEFYFIADKARKKHTNWSDYLFLERDIYDYKIDYEFSILGYYVNNNNNLTNKLVETSMKVLNYPYLEDGIFKNVMNNYKFYTQKMIDSVGINKKNTEEWTKVIHSLDSMFMEKIDRDEFVSSTPSIIKMTDDEFIVNIRYVNYRIDNKGGYVNMDKITTINVIGIVKIVGNLPTVMNGFILNYNKDEDERYVGLEDVRLYKKGDQILYNANRGLKNGGMTIEHGEIDLNAQKCVNSVLLKREGSGSLEKNWVLFDKENTTKVVYGWSPLIVGEIENGNEFVERSRNSNVPNCFKHLRGSTNGVNYGDDEIWFLCHSVSYEDRRYYYHMIVVLDRKTLNVKKYTPFFTFEREKVEYTLGFSFLQNNSVLIGYSTYDKVTKFASFDKTYLDNMMIV